MKLSPATAALAAVANYEKHIGRDGAGLVRSLKEWLGEGAAYADRHSAESLVEYGDTFDSNHQAQGKPSLHAGELARTVLAAVNDKIEEQGFWSTLKLSLSEPRDGS